MTNLRSLFWGIGLVALLFVATISLSPKPVEAQTTKIAAPRTIYSLLPSECGGKTKVFWTSVVGAEGYNIYRLVTANSNQTYTLVGTAGASARSYIDTPGAGSFTYTITAFNSVGESVYPNSIRANASAPCPTPLAVSCSIATTTPETKVGKSFYWMINASGGKSGTYFYKAKDTTLASSGRASDFRLYDKTIVANYPTPGLKTAEVSVQRGTEFASTTCSVTIASTPPPAPTNVRGVAFGTCGTQAKITWNRVLGATGYKIYRTTAAQGFKQVEIGTTQNLEFIDQPGQGQFSYQVASYSDAGTSALSAGLIAVAVSSECFTASCEMTTKNPRVNENVVWNAVPKGGSGNYRVVSWTGDDGLTGKISASMGISKKYTTLGEKKATLVIQSGTQRATTTCSAVILPALPKAPSSISATVVNNCEKTVDVTWNPSQGAESYKLYRAPSVVGPFTEILNAATTTYRDVLPEEGTYIYKVLAYNTGGESAAVFSNTVAQVVCADEGYGDDGDIHDDKLPGSLFPDYSYFTAKHFGRADDPESFKPIANGYKQDMFLVYSLNPEKPDEWYKARGCGNLFCDEDDRFSYIYFPKNPPEDMGPFESEVIEILTDSGPEKIVAYELIEVGESEKKHAEGIKNFPVTLPMRFTSVKDSDSKYIGLGMDEAFKMFRTKEWTLNGSLTIRQKASNGKYDEERKEIEITTAKVDFNNTRANGSSWSGAFFKNDSAEYGDNGIEITRYGCDGPVREQGYMQMVWTWLYDGVYNSSDRSIETEVNYSTYAQADFTRGYCEDDPYPSNGSYVDFGSTRMSNYDDPVVMYSITIKDADGEVIDVVNVYGDRSYVKEVKITGSLEIKISEYDTYDGMFTKEGLLDDNPEFTGEASEINYLSSAPWYNKVYADINQLIKYNPVTASVSTVFSSFQRIVSNATGLSKDSQMAVVYKKSTKKKTPRKIARNSKGSTPRKAARVINLDSEYLTRDYIARMFAHGGQSGNTFNAAPCKTDRSIHCTLVFGLDSDFILRLAQIRQAFKNDRPKATTNIIINGATEFWLHGNRSNVRSSNGTSHGFPMTVDIDKVNGIEEWILKNFKKYPECSKVYNVEGIRFYNEDRRHFHVEGYPSVKSNCIFTKTNIK